jgi:pilus assembly protein CpaE
MPSGAVRVFIVGPDDSPSLRGMLSLRRDVVVVGNDLDVPLVADLNGGIDVVLLNASRRASLSADVAKIRERTAVPVVIALRREDESLLDEVLALDPADVVVLPQPAEVIAFTIRKAGGGLISTVDDRDGKVITVFSPKGGTGKSVISTNLAVAFTRGGSRTLLIDLDLMFGDAALMLSLGRDKSIYDVVSASEQLDAEKLGAYLLEHDSGVMLLAAPPRPQDAEGIDNKRIASLLDIAKASFDVIVIDTAPLFDAAMLTALDRSDLLLLICGHDVPSVKNVRLGLSTLGLLRFPNERITLVGNRRGMPGGIKTGELESVLKRALRFVLPEDEAVPSCVNRGVPVVSTDEKSAFAAAIQEMAGELSVMTQEDGIPTAKETARSMLSSVISAARR